MHTATHPIKLKTDYLDREQVKAAGARWDNAAKAWFVPVGAALDRFAPWLEQQRKPRMVEFSKMAFALCVGLEQKDEAKADGAVWDGVRKAWFAPKGREQALERFKVQPHMFVVGSGDPHQERANALRQAGIDEDDPIVDNEIHRGRLIDGKKNSKDGAYVFSDEGIPSGVIWNHKTGLKLTWRCGSAERAELSQTQRTALAAHNELTRHQRAAETDARYEAASVEAQAEWNSIQERHGHSPYAQRKNVGLYGVKVIDGVLVVPARDVDGKLWTYQTISPEKGGMKKFKLGGKKAGCFHLIGEIKPGFPILVAEGYATAATLHEATGRPVAVAFDAGNLLPVGTALASRHPESMLAFMADNDQYGPTNVGIEKAAAAAKAVCGAVVHPRFDSIDGKPTDWNDLAALDGFEAVQCQVGEGLKMERARLRQACFEQVLAQKPSAQRVPVNCRDGHYLGVAQRFPGGLVALHGAGADVGIHEARLIEGPIEDGRLLTLTYENGRGKMHRAAEIKAPLVYGQSR